MRAEWPCGPPRRRVVRAVVTSQRKTFLSPPTDAKRALSLFGNHISARSFGKKNNNKKNPHKPKPLPLEDFPCGENKVVHTAQQQCPKLHTRAPHKSESTYSGLQRLFP